MQNFLRRDFPPIPTYLPSITRIQRRQLCEKLTRLMWAGSTTSPGLRWMYPPFTERYGKGPSRTYSVTATTTDIGGNVSAANVKILVPQDKRK